MDGCNANFGVEEAERVWRYQQRNKPPEKIKPSDLLDILLFDDNTWCYYHNLYNIRYTPYDYTVIPFGSLDYFLFTTSKHYINREKNCID